MAVPSFVELPVDPQVTVQSASVDSSVKVQTSRRFIRDRRPPKYLQDYITLAHTDCQNYVDAIAGRGEQAVMDSIDNEFASLYIEMKAVEPCFTDEHKFRLHLFITGKFDACESDI